MSQHGNYGGGGDGDGRTQKRVVGAASTSAPSAHGRSVTDFYSCVAHNYDNVRLLQNT